MNGIDITIDPVILTFGPFELRWYSLAIIVAVIVATLITGREASKKGISSDEIYYLLPWVLIAGLIGARLFHVVDQWAYYVRNPLEIIAFQQGGLAIWGALVGGGVAVIIYARVRHLQFGRLADALVPGLLIAQIIGRAGCIINGDSPGSMTDLPWGFIYLNPDSQIPNGLFGVPTHPYPVYEMLWNGLVLLFLLKIRRVFKTDGLFFLSYLVCYSIGRFLLSYARVENVVFAGLQQAQLIAVLTAAASLAVFIYLSMKKARTVTEETDQPDNGSGDNR